MKLYSKIFHYILNHKYLFSLILFLGYMFFMDNYNLYSRAVNHLKIKKLKEEIAYYERLISQNKARKHELQSSDENIEKFAREQYLMKRKNEDIFIVNE